MKVSTILDQIDLGAIALPEFQRGYVWNRDQVRGLMQSLYRRHPVGSLLVWVTKTEDADARGDQKLSPGVIKLLLDGQQRITSLYGIIKGRAPKFFDGNIQTFTGLYFHLDEEIFEFYMPAKMRNNPLWVNVTDCMQKGAGESIKTLLTIPELQSNLTTYINRLNSLDVIRGIDLHIEEVVGEDKTVDVVVDIFNNVNSGGTKLSKGDLALAKICAPWPEARQEMKSRLKKWSNAGFYFRLELLLRSINAITTGEALFSALKNVNTQTFKDGLVKAEKATDQILNLISSRLGLDHDRVLGSKGSLPLLARYIDQKGGLLKMDHTERDCLLYWYVNTLLWGRYAGSTESVLNLDLGLIENLEGGLVRLIGELRKNRGDLNIQPKDFSGWSQGARFYPLLYMLTRVCHSRDLASDIELSNHMLGNLNTLQLHHIFPKGQLYKQGYTRPQVNALANFTFLTQETNLMISDKDPAVYLAEFNLKNPGALESHWIPSNPELWKIENYLQFLEERRSLLASAANKFLNSLLAGSVPEVAEVPPITERVVKLVPGGYANEEEEQVIVECDIWVAKQGLPAGERFYELVDATTNEPLAVIDLAWPTGIQQELSEPVALLIDEEPEMLDIVNAAGYRYFTDVESLKVYIKREILAEDEPELVMTGEYSED